MIIQSTLRHEPSATAKPFIQFQPGRHLVSLFRNAMGAFLCGSAAFAEPAITSQPVAQSVSLGANVALQVRASGASPLAYQWRFNDLPIAGATSNRLELAGVQLKDAGSYAVAVSDATGAAVLSQKATVEVDPTFTKVTAGDLVTVPRDLSAPAWGDYDNDGDIDLFVAAVSGQDLFYQNNGDGTFTRLAASEVGPIIGTGQINLGVWADFDNDGYLDLFRMSANGLERLYRNLGNGRFNLFTNTAFARDIDSAFGTAWGDFDQDGFVDLAVTVGDISGGNYAPSQILARNDRGASFTRLVDPQLGSIVTERGGGNACAWADFDEDGDLDLFVGNNRTGANKAFLFRNEGGGRFTRLTEGPIANDLCFPFSADWGDYDNDGNLDLIVGNAGGRRNSLYHNLGRGQFERVERGNIVEDPNITSACAWADYDNDGFLDLIIGNTGKDFLYRGHGDGTFTRILSGSPSNDSGPSNGLAWGDYDNDGFMDLFVANGGSQLSYLYRNSGNSNHWLKLKLTGTASNRSTIGAKIRLKTVIAGREVWQLRQIAGGHEVGQNDLRPNFGLGDATVVQVIRIEWPSGVVQELRDLPANQIVHVTEPVRFVPEVVLHSNEVNLKVTAWPGFDYDVEQSADLKTWTPVAGVTTTNNLIRFENDGAAMPRQFFRVSVRDGLKMSAPQNSATPP